MTRDRIRAYNTCAGYNYNTRSVARRSLRAGEPAPKSEGRYDDQIAFVHRADELAQSLLEEGYTAMKIWPFDPYAEDNGGGFIPERDLDVALEPWRKIRMAVGDRIEVMAEFHSLWNLQQAKQIARVEPYWSLVGTRSNARRDTPADALDNDTGVRANVGGVSVPRRARHQGDIARSTSPGAADCRKRARSPRLPRPGSARWRRMTATVRWSGSPPSISWRTFRTL
jgi:hypothetical protein